jgi:hypothetical protein
MKNKGYIMVLFGKTNGNVIPQGMNKRIKAFIRKNYEKGVSIETLKRLVLEAFERDNIKGSLTIIKDGVKIFSIGN